VPSGEIAERVRDLVRQTCEAFEIRIIKGVVSKDHVHILVSAPPNRAPSEIRRRIKGRTSSYLFEEFPHLKKRYWGRHFWARGYFCATVGQMTDEMIKHYLEHHFEPNPNDNFKMEPDKMRRLVDAYPDFQSVSRNHPLERVVV
jgi:putative transposase